MSKMGLNITQTYAKIGIDRSPTIFEMTARDATLELRQKHAKVNIHTELPRVEIDQYEAFASAGLKNNADIVREAVQRGYQKAYEYIGKVVQDGNALAAIENGGNPIAEIARRDSLKMHEFDIDFIPKVGPEITVKGDIDINFDKNSQGVNNGVDGNYTPANLNINYTPGQVRVFLSQYASIKFDYEKENKINTYI